MKYRVDINVWEGRASYDLVKIWLGFARGSGQSQSLDFCVQIWYSLLKYRIYGGTNIWQSLLFSSSLRGVVPLFRAFPGCYLPRSTLRDCWANVQPAKCSTSTSSPFLPPREDPHSLALFLFADFYAQLSCVYLSAHVQCNQHLHTWPSWASAQKDFEDQGLKSPMWPWKYHPFSYPSEE